MVHTKTEKILGGGGWWLGPKLWAKLGNLTQSGRPNGLYLMTLMVFHQKIGRLEKGKTSI